MIIRKTFVLALLLCTALGLWGFTPPDYGLLYGTAQQYVISIYGRDIGKTRTLFSRETYRGQTVLGIRSEAVSLISKGGETFKVQLNMELFVDSLGLPVFFSYENSTSGDTFTCEAREDGLVFLNNKGQVTGSFAYESGVPFEFFYPYLIPDTLEPGEEAQFVTYSIDTEQQELVLEQRRVKLQHREVLELGGRAFEAALYQVEIVTKYRTETFMVWIGPDKQVLREVYDRVLVFSYVPGQSEIKYGAFEADKYDRLMARQKVRLTPRALTMEVVLTHPGGWPAAYFPQTAYQSIIKRGPQEVVLELKRSFNTIPPELTREIIPEEAARYLEATGRIQADHERIREQARRILQGEKSIRGKVERLLAWVYLTLSYSASGPELTSIQVLDQKRGDCSEYATLLTALLRAAGIPARMVGGLKYGGGGIFGMHAWVELYAGGHWYQVDPVEGNFPGPYLIGLANESFVDTLNTTISILQCRLDNGRLLLPRASRTGAAVGPDSQVPHLDGQGKE